jgi:O-antigen ligase
VFILGWINFVILGLVTVIGPWMFGAWEMWWFWGFAMLICLSLLITGMQLIIQNPKAPHLFAGQVRLPLLAALPFLAYALISWWHADVFMSAERSVLLYLSGGAVAFSIAYGLRRQQQSLLLKIIFANLLAIGAYGIINHLAWKSTHVLWARRYPQYAGRALGTYFCPDHFAGIMEIMLCIALAMLVARRTALWLRLAALLAGCGALVAIALTLSRGGLLTLPIIFGGIFIWGFAQWPAYIRRSLRIIAIASGLLLVMVLVYSGGRHIERLTSYGGHWGQNLATKTNADKTSETNSLTTPLKQNTKHILTALSRTSRGRMYGGAWRAWQSSPWLGIGAGMHQNLWPHFAATNDGNREKGIWPTLPNDNFHSYEVHNDWLQLLEEYGIIGVILFLIPFGTILFLLVRGIHENGRTALTPDYSDEDNFIFVEKLSALLILLAMAFHSFGDFNLQMPATVWILAAITSIALSTPAEDENSK